MLNISKISRCFFCKFGMVSPKYTVIHRSNIKPFADNCPIERDRFGGGSVMVWGGIMGRRKTNLIVVQGNLNAQGYINQIPQPEAVPFLQRHGPAILMHDNARPRVDSF